MAKYANSWQLLFATIICKKLKNYRRYYFSLLSVSQAGPIVIFTIICTYLIRFNNFFSISFIIFFLTFLEEEKKKKTHLFLKTTLHKTGDNKNI